VSASIVVAHITADRLDDWRAFVDELTTTRRPSWAESQRRRGITRESVYLWADDGGPAAVYVVEGANAGTALEALEASNDEFDRWYRERLADIHDRLGFPVRLFDSRPPPGSWRGWLGRLGGRRLRQ
jgi:hypothetical protein